MIERPERLEDLVKGMVKLDNRATCGICLRRITVDEQRYLRTHNRRTHLRRGQEPERCPGSGTQPLDQGRLDVGK